MSLVEAGRPVQEELDRTARETALRAVGGVSIEPTSLVSYRSLGRLLIIGEPAQALDIGATLEKHALDCFALVRGEGISRVEGDIPTLFISPRLGIRITGHLGDFTVVLDSAEHGEVNVAQALGAAGFDLILDLSVPSLLGWDVLPFGYYAPGDDQAELARALVELSGLVGEFEKAKFFQYNPDICAHGNRGLKGCTRCLETCPTGAIASLGDKIAVDPYSCQGIGSCATACPTGAIIYSFPAPADTLNRLRVLLRAYREAGGAEPVLLFHDAQTGQERLQHLADALPGRVMAVAVEEVGSLGMDTWLAALAYGASRVLLLATPQVPASVLREVREQLAFAQALLEGIGYPAAVLGLVASTIDDAALLAGLERGASMPPLKPAGFAGSNAKRDTLYYAIDYLAAQAPALPRVVPLPERAPFGEIRVDRAACTLCMACVSVCPASALFDGGDTPRLEFLEASCVQCGLCATACPEEAIALTSRFLFDTQQRRRRRVLNEEEAFCCIACGKPFATRSLIERMTAKLQGHWMFQDPAALRRLQLCGDCRVRDLLGESGGRG